MHVTVLTDFGDTSVQDEGSAKGLRVSMVSPTNLSTERQQRLKSALKISTTLTSQQSEELMQCAVEHHRSICFGDDGEIWGK